MDAVKKALTDTYHDGARTGLSMAIDTLRAAQPNVAAENQNWESAIAVLEILLAEHKALRPTPKDE